MLHLIEDVSNLILNKTQELGGLTIKKGQMIEKGQDTTEVDEKIAKTNEELAKLKLKKTQDDLK